MAIVNIFRGISGSQYVYWNSTQADPANTSNKVMVGNLLTADTVDTASIVAEAVASGSDVLWKWNGTDASQFELAVVNSGQFATASFRPLTSGSDVSPGLRLHCTWSGGGGAALFPLSASEFTVPASG